MGIYITERESFGTQHFEITKQLTAGKALLSHFHKGKRIQVTHDITVGRVSTAAEIPGADRGDGKQTLL